MNRSARLLKVKSSGQASMNAVTICAQGAAGGDLRLTALERGLLGEALRLLADSRARALQLTTEFSRRQGIAVPDVHDFQLPTIVDLQRRFSEQETPLAE